MKIAIPNSLDGYIDKTEHAVKNYYYGLDSCWSFYQKALEHWDISQINEPLTPERKEALDKYLAQAGKYFDLKLSEAMFAGSILQMAYMAIRLYSKNNTYKDKYSNFVQATQKSAMPFCVGRELHGIPIGLIVYAGRNQYAHWDEEESHKTTRSVFRSLSAAFMDTPFSDLAFELSNPTIPVYASEVLLTALKWTDYQKYVTELKDILWV